MVLLIDANIILDVLMNRSEFVRDSSLVWKLCESNQVKGYLSSLTFANLSYIMRKQLDPDRIKEIFKKLSLIFEFTDFGVSDLNTAVDFCWTDFEDAIQSATAERLNADYIVTRNIRDFSKSRIPACTPAEFLSKI